MSIMRKIKERIGRRIKRVRGSFSTISEEKLRISVFRSNKNFYAQVIDDSRGVTLESVVSGFCEEKGDKKKMAYAAGVKLADILAKKHSSRKFFFDRGKFLYHGRVKAFAEGLRSGGIVV